MSRSSTLISRRQASLGAETPLCCCEYYSLQGERSHIMAMCCECEALDEACDRLLKCERVPNSTIDRMFDAISDRLRLPWCLGGGAIKVRLDVILPVVVVPMCLCLATLHPVVTAMTFLFMLTFVQAFHTLWRRRVKTTGGSPPTPFFFVWAVTSVLTSYAVFQVFLMIFREVLLWEILLMFTLVSCLFYLLTLVKGDPGELKIRSRTTERRSQSSSNLSMEKISLPLYDQRSGDHFDSSHQLYSNAEGSDLVTQGMPDIPPRAGYCKVCDCYIAVRDHHCIWINSCVGASNHRAFLLAMMLFVVTGAYGAHLTMTTVCTPTMHYDWFLLPNDCRWLYIDFITAICFVTAVYAILATICVSLALIFQVVLISQNVTAHELVSAHRQGRTSYLIWVKDNPNNQGLLRNWTEFWLLSGRTAFSRGLVA